MPSEKQISCVADAIDFALGDIKKARLFVDRIELIKDVVRKALTAAEQAEPAPTYDAPLGAIENGRVFLQRLVDRYDFQCEAGGLANCSDYHEVVRCFEAMAEWIYHHAPAARSGAVKVKPLEWVRGWMNAEAQTDIGLYQIAYRRDGSFEWCFGVKKEWTSSWDAAKAAAQADYERRILAALEPAEPATDAEPVASVSPTSSPESRLSEALANSTIGARHGAEVTLFFSSGKEAEKALSALTELTALAQEDGR